MTRLLLVSVLGMVLCATGCGPQVVEIDTTRLRTLRQDVDKLPDPPTPPSPRRHTKESVVNRINPFRGHAPLSNRPRLAVIAGETLPRHVTDSMIFELKQAGANVVDREYSHEVAAEIQRLQEGVTSAGSKEVKGRSANVISADYAVIIHRVIDNSDRAQPAEIVLGSFIDAGEWAEYEQKKNAYKSTVGERVQRYNAEVERVVSDAATRIATEEQKWGPGQVPYRFTGTQPVSPKVTLPRTELLAQELRTALAIQGLGPPGAIKPLYEYPGQLLPPDSDRRDFGTVYNFAISVRVVDMTNGMPVWIGFEEAQNLSYVEAVRTCCSEIARNMIGPGGVRSSTPRPQPRR